MKSFLTLQSQEAFVCPFAHIKTVCLHFYHLHSFLFVKYFVKLSVVKSVVELVIGNKDITLGEVPSNIRPNIFHPITNNGLIGEYCSTTKFHV